MLRQEIKDLVKLADDNKPTLAHNEILFDIYEGDLLTYVMQDLKASLSPQSFNSIQSRVSPVNILKRVIDKLSKIYSKPPIRTLVKDSEIDKELFTMYQKYINPNGVFGMGNRFFNLFKNTLIEPYIYEGKPYARVIPSDRFFVYSDNAVDPMCPTHILKYMGKVKINGREEKVIYAYTDTEFLICNDKGDVLSELMVNNPNGVNIYGKLPFVYINRSHHRIIPTIDTDTLKMTKLIPILLSDLNYAVMYQSFSVIYGVDVNFENIEMSPNAFWSLKSDATTGTAPQIGSIKPQVDIDQVLNFIASQIALWMQTKNIKATGIATLTVDNAASGIAKAIDEMDTAEDRQEQTVYFKEAEEDFWRLIINYMHPVWMNDPTFELKIPFSAGQEVMVQFPEQKAIMDETTIIDNAIKKYQGGFISKEMAVKEMYPDKSEDEIQDIMEDAQEGEDVELPEEPQPQDIEVPEEETQQYEQ